MNDNDFVRGQLEALAAMSDDAIVGRSLDGLVVSWNAGAERLLGYTADEIVGTSFEVIVPPELVDASEALFTRVLAGEAIKGIEAVRIRKDGTPVDVSIDLAPIRDASGSIIGVSVMARDISELVQAERAAEAANEALRRADERKNTFLRTLSHDVRSPLTAVLSAAKLLEDGERLDAARRTEFSRMIVRNAHRIRRLLDDVLDVERLTQGDGFVPECERVDVETTFRQVIDELNTTRRLIELHCDVASIEADPILFERTLYNLIGNALKHTDGPISVRTFPGDGGVVLAVEDRGPGIAADGKTEIFEPFMRGTDEHVPGTGVGLSLVAAFARAHEGRAWVEDRDGGGSSFLVFFPDSDG